jgi:hypothetical protein
MQPLLGVLDQVGEARLLVEQDRREMQRGERLGESENRESPVGKASAEVR